jgi:hypothetical protein
VAIIKNKILLAEFRAKASCEWCTRWCPGEIDPHHLFGRGVGGGYRLDVVINLLALCRLCHQKYHDGKIKRKWLVTLVGRREGRAPRSIVEEIYRLRRAPKGAKA